MCKAAMARYSELAKGGKPGPPHIHAFLGFLEGAKMLEGGGDAAELREFGSKYEHMSECEQCLVMPFFSMKKIQKDDVVLVQYRARDAIVEMLVKNVMTKEAWSSKRAGPRQA